MKENTKEILGLIPARGGSKGIAKKNIKELGGKPLIEYTFDAAKKSQKLTRTILTTDSKEIATLGRKAGIEVPFLRPEDISRDDSSAIEYVKHALTYLEDQEGYRPFAVVILQPTAPLRSADDIDACLAMLLESDADCLVSVSSVPSHHHPSWQLTIGQNDEALLCSGERWSALVSRRQDLEPTFIRNGAVYAFKRETFFKAGSLYGEEVIAYQMPQERSVNIDDEHDWLLAQLLITGESRRGEL